MTTVATDDFELGELLLWTAGTNWAFNTVDSNTVMTSTAGIEPLTFAHTNLLDVSASLDLQLNGGSMAINLRESEAGRYSLTLNANGIVALYRDATLLEGTTLAPLGTDWHTVTLSTVGDIVRVKVDDVTLLAVQDPAPLPAGGFSVASVDGGTLAVDNFALAVPMMQQAEAITLVEPYPSPTPNSFQMQSFQTFQALVTDPEPVFHTIISTDDATARIIQIFNTAATDLTKRHIILLTTDITITADIDPLVGDVVITTDPSVLQGNLENRVKVTQLDPINKTPQRAFTVESGARLVVRDVIFNGFSSTASGATLYNRGQLYVYNVTFNNNKTMLSGSTIGDEELLYIWNSEFVGNISRLNTSNFGGAVKSIGTIAITCATFSSNNGGKSGAILSYGNLIINGITKSNFVNNTSTNGVSDIHGDNVIVDNSWWATGTPTVAVTPSLSNINSGVTVNALATQEIDITDPADCPEPDAVKLPVVAQLLAYGIDTSGIQGGDGITRENILNDWLIATQITAQALCKFANGGADCNDLATEQATFREIMIGNANDTITVLSDLQLACATTVEALLIQCRPNENPQTYVHELGHIFLYRTRSATVVNANAQPCIFTVNNSTVVDFRACMESPTDGTNGSLGFGINFIFGIRTETFNQSDITYLLDKTPANLRPGITATSFTYNLCFDGRVLNAQLLCEDTNNPNRPPIPPSARPGEDWIRGGEGWEGETVQGVGTCDDATTQAIPTTFQRNICQVFAWMITGLTDGEQTRLKLIELEEAGADMFLNWVYRSLDITAINSNVRPFSDNASGIVPPPFDTNNEIEGPGDVRFTWMNQELTSFFDYYGWYGV